MSETLDLNVRPVADPRVAVTFTLSVTQPTAHLGPRLDPIPKPTVRLIQQTVADYYRLSVSDLLSDQRARYVSRPRQVAMWLCKELTTRSLPDLGRRFGGRDHTTVLFAVRRIEALRLEDSAVRRDCRILLDKLGGTPR